MVGDRRFVEVWRGELLESVHSGHAVVATSEGEIVEAWGDPDQIIYPRSSCKMLQALPLINSGAADAAGLTSEHLALACASHEGAEIHSARVRDWLTALNLAEPDLRCGPQEPSDKDARNALIREGAMPCQLHNNCSGKHAGFLTLNKHLGGGPDYVEVDHPLQLAVRAAFEEMTGETAPGFGIDGCSAPNFATSIAGLARAAARMTDGNAAASRLVEAMMRHPELVAGKGRACTELMQAAKGEAAIKTGAEGVFVAILPKLKRGIAVKITDGATRAAECTIAALLVKYSVLARDHPAAVKRMHGPIKNWRGIETGYMRPSDLS